MALYGRPSPSDETGRFPEQSLSEMTRTVPCFELGNLASQQRALGGRMCQEENVNTKGDDIMASILRRKTGAVAIQFLDLRGKRRTLGLGSAPERFVKRAAEVVDDLLDAARFGQPAPAGATAWLEGLNNETFERFVAAGLVVAREKRREAPVTVAEHAEAYLARRTDLRPSSRIVLRHVVRNIVAFFGDKAIAEVTRGDGDDFARWLAKEGRSESQVENKGTELGAATVGKRLQHASTIFNDAVRRGLIPSNVLSDVKKPGATNADRQQYVPAEVIETLIELEPDLEWRALLALARYQGVRTPSEPFSPKRFRSSCSGIRSVGSNCGIRVRCRLRGRGRKVPRLSPRSAGLRRGAAS